MGGEEARRMHLMAQLVSTGVALFSVIMVGAREQCTTDGAFNDPNGTMYSRIHEVNGTLMCSQTCIGHDGLGLCPTKLYSATHGLQERSCIAANFTQEVRFEFVDSVCNLEVYKVPYQLFSHPRPVETTYKENVKCADGVTPECHEGYHCVAGECQLD